MKITFWSWSILLLSILYVKSWEKNANKKIGARKKQRMMCKRWKELERTQKADQGSIDWDKIPWKVEKSHWLTGLLLCLWKQCTFTFVKVTCFFCAFYYWLAGS